MKLGLIVIDPQVDFCEGGKLAVNGANQAMKNIKEFIVKNASALSSIDITMDAHHLHHISHPIMWVNSEGKHPDPLTNIKASDCKGENPIWRASNGFLPTPLPKDGVTTPTKMTDLKDYNTVFVEYLDKLESAGRYPHTIWPPHCIIGTPGMCLHPDIIEALETWETLKKRPANKVTKGSYLFSEHFSVFQAEVQYPQIPETGVNTTLIQHLEQYDTLIWTGLAEDFCLANSFRDFIENCSGGDEQTKKEIAKKMVFAIDGTAAVGVPGLKESFHDYIDNLGVKKVKLNEYL